MSPPRAITEHVAARVERLRLTREDATRTVDDLAGELAGIVDQQTAIAPDDEHDAEGSTIGFERARVTALLAHARQVVADLDEARTRVLAGGDGCCAACGGTIPEERQSALPTATTCVGCASAAAGGRRLLSVHGGEGSEAGPRP